MALGQFKDSRKFPHTKAALEIYDAGKPARENAWNRAESNADVDAADAADKAALQLVQKAFHQDTADINSLSHCMLVDLNFMRRMVKESLT